MKRKARIFFGLIVVFLALFFLPESITRRLRSTIMNVFTPFVSSLTRAGESGEFFFSGKADLLSENEMLKMEVERLGVELSRLNDVERRNRALRKQLGLYSRHRDRLIAARVVARDFSGWWNSITIDKGTAHGLEKGLPVLCAGGLVGRIEFCSGYMSDVLLMVDPSSKVAVKFPRTGAFGVMSGTGISLSGEPSCRVEFVSKTLDAQKNDRIVTSGLGGVYPGGVPVGYVINARIDRSGLFQNVDVRPSADLDRLDYVFVLRGEQDWLENRLFEKAFEIERVRE